MLPPQIPHKFLTDSTEIPSGRAILHTAGWQNLWKASGSYEQNHQKGGGRRRSAGRGTVRVRGVAPAITREILKRHGARFGVES